jgi:hypothetical protein
MTMRRQRRAFINTWRRVRRSPRWEIVAQIWIAIVAVVLLRQAFGYLGLAGRFAEWEYETFGRHLPFLSLLMLIALFGAPALIIMWLMRRRERRLRHERWGEGDTGKVAASLVRTEGTVFQLLLICASGALLIALAALVLAYRLPTGGQPQRLDARVAGQPRDGAATLVGAALYRRTATFQQQVFLLKRTVQLVPVVDPRDPAVVRFFAEVTPDRLEALNGGRNNPPFTGVLRRNALPGAVLRLFRYAGFRVDPPHYVLFASTTTLRWPFYVVAIDAGLVAVFLMLLALFQRRRVRQVEQRVRDLLPLPAQVPAQASA